MYGGQPGKLTHDDSLVSRIVTSEKSILVQKPELDSNFFFELDLYETTKKTMILFS